ncbi:MAG: hypothetical protein ACR2JC_18450 [Chloroflexota bacterium]
MTLDDALALKHDVSAWNETDGRLDEIRIVTYDGLMFWVEIFATDDWLTHQLVIANRDTFVRMVGAARADQQGNGE